MNISKIDPISYVVITFNRPNELKKLILSIKKVIYNEKSEIIIIDNSNSKHQDINNKNIEEIKKNNCNIKYFQQTVNKGVAGGRNIGLEKTKYNYCLFIDDDAHFEINKDIEKYINYFFKKDKNIAAIAFNSKNNQNQINRIDIPLSIRKSNSKRYVNYLIGCGHCLHKNRIPFLSNKGSYTLYATDSLYGAEDLDLSLRIYLNNLKIIFIPQISIIHNHSKAGRLNNQIFENIKAVNFVYSRYLPFLISKLHTLVFSMKFFIQTRSIKNIFKILRFNSEGISKYPINFTYFNYTKYIFKVLRDRYL